jgi:hypothetical protein
MEFSRALTGRAAPLWGRCAAAAALALVVAAPAAAEICKYIDADGNIHYSNVPPDKGFRRLSCTLGDESPKKSPSAAPATANGNAGAGSAPARPALPASAPAGFPRVDAETQKGRDDVRRKVLGDELSAEEKLLAEARTAYADGAPQPLPEERNDAEKYRQRIARLRESVALHEKNIEAIRKELAAMR